MKSISTPSESATTVARQAVSAQYTIPSCVKQRFWYRLLVGRNDTCTSLWSTVTVPCGVGLAVARHERMIPMKERMIPPRRNLFVIWTPFEKRNEIVSYI